VAAGLDSRPPAREAASIAVLHWLADENFNNYIIRALFRAKLHLDMVRAQDVGFTGAHRRGRRIITACC